MKKEITASFIVTIVVALFIVALIFGLAVNRPAVTTKFPNTIQDVMPSVVHIMCDRWQGSGVAITPDIIATARHVVDGISYTVTLNNGEGYMASQAISHKDYDIGFIKLDLDGVLTPAKFGSIKDCVLGQSIFIIGSPFGKINFNNVTLGIISGLDRDWDSLSWEEPYGWKIAFTTDSGAHPGNSGGPVFSMDGVVRGLLVGGFSPVLNCSMPSDLFLGDIEVIKLLFAQEKYKVEQEKIYGPEDWYGRPIEIEPCKTKDYYLGD
ncbi:hypothetical protein LCGC14_0578960 [marine sediment metagenome]|uniref:Serine protease n=1 Tax=marine sediment metagenome TaxID=412755 RepID=A0A0F9S0I1_9ZZZZ